MKNSWKLLPLLSVIFAVASHQPLAAEVAPTLPPTITIPSAQSEVTVRLENQTPAAITYEALGDTQPRLLTSGDDVLLQNLNTPTTLTFFYQDIQKNRQAGEGLLTAAIEVNEATGNLEVVVKPTTSLGSDVSNITIEPSGNVFVF
ncbi:MAG: hypothetical protein AAF821_17860 [Cyanobacteria bacterium P01_D01_bin.156]